MRKSPINRAVMLTTYDNPYDPFTQYDQWRACDEDDLGHWTCGLLARLTHDDDALTDAERVAAVEDAIDRIIALFGNMYRKVEREIDDPNEKDHISSTLE